MVSSTFICFASLVIFLACYCDGAVRNSIFGWVWYSGSTYFCYYFKVVSCFFYAESWIDLTSERVPCSTLCYTCIKWRFISCIEWDLLLCSMSLFGNLRATLFCEVPSLNIYLFFQIIVSSYRSCSLLLARFILSLALWRCDFRTNSSSGFLAKSRAVCIFGEPINYVFASFRTEFYVEGSYWASYCTVPPII